MDVPIPRPASRSLRSASLIESEKVAPSRALNQSKKILDLWSKSEVDMVYCGTLPKRIK